MVDPCPMSLSSGFFFFGRGGCGEWGVGQRGFILFSFLVTVPITLLSSGKATLHKQPWNSLLSRQQRKSLVIHQTSCETNGTDLLEKPPSFSLLLYQRLSSLLYGCKGKGWLELPRAGPQWVPLCQLRSEDHSSHCTVGYRLASTVCRGWTIPLGLGGTCWVLSVLAG